jgi:hypothetical protein
MMKKVLIMGSFYVFGVKKNRTSISTLLALVVIPLVGILVDVLDLS